MTTQYWFARRYPLGDPRNGMAPVHWKGVVVSVGFVAILLIGGGLWAWLAAGNRAAEGAALFTVCAFVDGMWFIQTSRERGDRIRTVADYREQKSGV